MAPGMTITRRANADPTYLGGILYYRRSRNKFGARRTADGFPSKLEAAVYKNLLDRERLGEISNIRRQVVVRLLDGPKDLIVNWKIDFSFEEKGQTVYAEAKGIETSDFKIKLKLFRKLRIAPIEIWKGTWRYPKMVKRYETTA
jgi:hypothetical protein